MSAPDIVTRLRTSVANQIGERDTLTEAGDEIERLRAENARLRTVPDLVERHLDILEAERRADAWERACVALAVSARVHRHEFVEFLAERGLTLRAGE